MSNPLDPSKTNTSTTVKCHNVHHDSASAQSSPETRTKSITTRATSPFDKTKRPQHTGKIEKVRRAATFGGSSSSSSPLLSERDTIFATHYLPSDGSDQTPRLLAAEGADDVANLPQDLEPAMELALPSSPPHSPISFKRLLSPTKPRSTQISNHVGQKRLPNPSSASIKLIEESSGCLHTGRRVASDGRLGKQILQLRVTDQNHLPSAENLRNSAGSVRMTTVESDGEEISHIIREIGQTVPELGSSTRDAFRQTGSTERSSSRGRTHVEKSIEATLPNREPAKNVRTRKSSHLMGIFKEMAPTESRKRDGQNRMERLRDDEGEEGSGVPLNESGISQPWSQTAISKPSKSSLEEGLQSITAIEVSHRPFGAHLADSPVHAEPSVSAVLSDTSTSSVSTPVSPSKLEHDPYFRKRDETKKSFSDKPPAIPPKLLEDIRNHRNLTPTGDRGAHLSNSLPSLIDVDKLAHFKGTKGVPESDLKQRHGDDEEHISSAVYFPHPGPSEDDIEQFTSPDEDQKIESGPSLPPSATSTPKAELKRTLSTTALPEHIDISVKSEHEKSVFHGDYRRTEELSDDDGEREPPGSFHEIAFDSASSASESEISSGEELSDLSQAREGDVTPTSTPIPKSPLQRRKRDLKPTGAKGAVVLEPYSHQVGGHSTMFRFSRRAVCKQLNNRENEFYERIEQRHPDMLRFLPRYIGVLNVTFSKGPKPSNSATAKARNETEKVQGQTSPEVMLSNGSVKAGRDQPQGHSLRAEVAGAPRIVSQSQEIGEVPRVILDQNRHIVPFSLFGSPERPRSADPHHAHTKGTLSPYPQAIGTTSEAACDTGSHHWAPYRPRFPENSASWGTTTVNSKLREQVLREVFGPPIIHHHKGHAKGHSTLPRLRTPNHKKTHLSAIDYDGHRRNASIPADQWRIPDTANMHELTTPKIELLRVSGEETASGPHSTSASEFEDVSRGLERVKTTASTGSQPSAGSASGRLRRRHSGMGLRRRRNSVSDNARGNLEYFEDDGYGGDGEDEMFSMEVHTSCPSISLSVPSSAVPQDLESPVRPQEASKRQSNEFPGSFKENKLGPGTKVPSPSTDHLPLNPKDAQTQSSDQRVVYFLLLEDLTAGMGRPCVLDLKMGTRQYGIEANKKKMESQRRKCKTTTSQQLGVRICGMQTFNVKKQKTAYEDKYFGRDVKAGREFRDALTRFLYDGISYSSVSRHIPTILDKISKLESMVRRLPGYRFYASSLLMLYDAEPHKSQKAREDVQKLKGGSSSPRDGGKPKKEKRWPPPIELKIVDFANCVTGEDELPPHAPCPPQHPDDIDRGYLRGLRTLRMYFRRILHDINQEQYVERGEGEGMAIGLGTGKQGPREGSIEDDAAEVSI